VAALAVIFIAAGQRLGISGALATLATAGEHCYKPFNRLKGFHYSPRSAGSGRRALLRKYRPWSVFATPSQRWPRPAGTATRIGVSAAYPLTLVHAQRSDGSPSRPRSIAQRNAAWPAFRPQMTTMTCPA